MAAMEDTDSPKAISNRGGDPYSVDIKAEAVALVFETGSYRQTERLMAERYPDRAPSRQLISRWTHQADPERVAALAMEREQAFRSGIMEMSLRAVEKLSDTLDTLPPEQIPIPAGISIDKGLKLLELDGRHPAVNIGTAYVLVQARDPRNRQTLDEPPTIEPDFRETPKPEP